MENEEEEKTKKKQRLACELQRINKFSYKIYLIKNLIKDY